MNTTLRIAIVLTALLSVLITGCTQPGKMSSHSLQSETRVATPTDYIEIGFVDVVQVIPPYAGENVEVKWRLANINETWEERTGLVRLVINTYDDLEFTAKPLGFRPDIGNVRLADMNKIQVFVIWDPRISGEEFYDGNEGKTFYYTAIQLKE